MRKVSKQEPIRVLQIGMHNTIGGVEAYLINYYRNINKNLIQFDFINHFDHLFFEDEIKIMGGNIYDVPSFKRHPIKYYLKIKKVINDNNYKIVHINMLSAANIIPILAAKRCNVSNIIVHSHNNGVPAGLIRRILHVINKSIIRKCGTTFYACSESAGKWMFGDKPFKIIKNGIDISKFKFNKQYREEIRKRHIIKNNEYVIGHIGRFDEQKNHDFIIDFFNEVSKIDEKARLMLIGEGQLESEIKDKVEKYNLKNKVIFVGTSNEVEKYYSAFDMFILPSKFEGLGIVNIEAQISNLPCVVSNFVPMEAKLNDNFYLKKIDCIEDWINMYKTIKSNQLDRNIDNNYEQYDIIALAKNLEKEYTKLL